KLRAGNAKNGSGLPIVVTQTGAGVPDSRLRALTTAESNPSIRPSRSGPSATRAARCTGDACRYASMNAFTWSWKCSGSAAQARRTSRTVIEQLLEQQADADREPLGREVREDDLQHRVG